MFSFIKKNKMTNPKYKLGDKHPTLNLYRVVAVRDFSFIKKGDIGGYIEKESNLFQEGDCWVYGDARVSGNARVYGSAWVSGNAVVYDSAWVSGNAKVSGDAQVYGKAQVYGSAWVSGNAQVYGSAVVYGDAQVYGNALVRDNAQVYGNAFINYDSLISKPEDLLFLGIHPYIVTITPQNITIGCQTRPRFGKNQWNSGNKDATPELIEKYSSLLRAAKKQVPRKKP